MRYREPKRLCNRDCRQRAAFLVSLCFARRGRTPSRVGLWNRGAATWQKDDGFRYVAATWAQHGQVTFRRRQPERSTSCVPSERLCRLTGETEGGRRPTSREDSAQRSAPCVPGERLCRLTGETEKAPGFRLTLANFAVLFSPLLTSPRHPPPSLRCPHSRS